ncbi:MAG: hypothetical protein RIR55_1266 [Bacteroidota bacterium]|jgi:hypothetical protein
MQLINNQNKFTKIGKLVIFISWMILSGIPWWVTNYASLTHKPFITISSILILGLFAGILKYITKHSFWELVFVGLSVHQLAFIIKIYIDGLEDPTNHNLAPFEMLLYLLIDLFICICFVGIGSLIKKIGPYS